MNVKELVLQGDVMLLLDPGSPAEVVRIFGSNTMSELIANAARGTLLLTSLNNSQLIRVAELMDAPGICLVDGAVPCAELLRSAKKAGMAILVSPHGTEATRLRLEARLRTAGAAGQ